MADATTTNLGLIQPEVGAATNTWGTSLNADILSIDNMFAKASTSVTFHVNNQNISGSSYKLDQIKMGDDRALQFGAAPDYWLIYDNSNTQFELNSTNVDGGGTDGVVFYVGDGTDDVFFTGEVDASQLLTMTMKLNDADKSAYVGLDAPATVSGTYILTFPAAVGAVDQVLSLSNTDGTLQWATPEVGDITSVVAGTGLSGGGTTGAVTLNVEASQTQITAVGTIATGVWNGTAIANANLANSTVNYGGVTLSLGGSDTTPAFALADATGYPGDSSLVTTGALNSGSITSGFTSIDVGSGAITTSGTVSGGTLTGTLSTAAQTNITSVGTLTSVTTSGDIVMDATDKIRLDGSASGNTYITEASADNVQIFTGGASRFGVVDSGIFIPATNKLYLDNGGNTYLSESSADVVTITTEGLDSFRFASSGGNPYIRLEAGNTGVGAIQYYEDDGGSGQVLKFQAGLRGADNNYYISTNATIHSSYALMASGQDVTIGGALAKGSGSFKIDHPLPSMKDTHSLVHSFMESPRADLQYRGSVTLANGTASVDLDESVGMTDGTWELLCRDPQVFLQNESGWSALKGSVSGSTLLINCENTNSTDTVSWMVVAERQDEHMMDTSWTDDDGRPILEPLKPEDVEDGS